MSKFKVRCTKSCDNRFIVGKTYSVGNHGEMRDEYGDNGYNCTTESFEEWYRACFWKHYAFKQVPESTTYELHITCNDGKTTNAVYKENGKIVKREKAVCAPSDTFDFAIGAQEAFDRVFPKVDTTQTAQAEKAESKFKAGDRVKIVGNHNLHCYKIGEIVTLEGKRQHHDSVDLYYWDTGKSCGYVREQDIEPYTEPTPTLTVTRDTLVKLGACSGGLAEFNRKFPSGEGEFETVVNATGEGNRIWLNRNKSCIEAMQNEPKKVEPTYLNMKVVCVSSSDRDFTVGKVYEFKNGQALDNTNVNRPTCERLKSLDDNYLKHWSYKFIEYKGEQS